MLMAGTIALEQLSYSSGVTRFLTSLGQDVFPLKHVAFRLASLHKLRQITRRSKNHAPALQPGGLPGAFRSACSEDRHRHTCSVSPDAIVCHFSPPAVAHLLHSESRQNFVAQQPLYLELC